MYIFKQRFFFTLILLISGSSLASLPGFNGNQYLAFNPDVAKAGVDPIQHFINNGYRENRVIQIDDINDAAKTLAVGTFSLDKYLTQYPDLKTAFASSGQSIATQLTSLFQHYQDFGSYDTEKRQIVTQVPVAMVSAIYGGPNFKMNCLWVDVTDKASAQPAMTVSNGILGGVDPCPNTVKSLAIVFDNSATMNNDAKMAMFPEGVNTKAKKYYYGWGGAVDITNSITPGSILNINTILGGFDPNIGAAKQVTITYNTNVPAVKISDGQPIPALPVAPILVPKTKVALINKSAVSTGTSSTPIWLPVKGNYVINAMYGSVSNPDKSIDVTSIIQPYIDSTDSTNPTISSSLFNGKDPAPGEAKQLTITYGAPNTNIISFLSSGGSLIGTGIKIDAFNRKWTVTQGQKLWSSQAQNAFNGSSWLGVIKNNRRLAATFGLNPVCGQLNDSYPCTSSDQCRGICKEPSTDGAGNYPNCNSLSGCLCRNTSLSDQQCAYWVPSPN